MHRVLNQAHPILQPTNLTNHHGHINLHAIDLLIPAAFIKVQVKNGLRQDHVLYLIRDVHFLGDQTIHTRVFEEKLNGQYVPY